MIKKILLYGIIFILSLSLVFAQSLFTSEGSTTFISTGIIIIFVIFFIKSQFNKKNN